MPFFMISNHFCKHLGLFISIAACAVVVGTQVRIAAQKGVDQGLMTELGLESAWPHGRADFSL